MLDKSRTLPLGPSIAIKMNREGTGYRQHGMSRSSTKPMGVVFICFIWTVNLMILMICYNLYFPFVTTYVFSFTIMPTFLYVFLLCFPCPMIFIPDEFLRVTHHTKRKTKLDSIGYWLQSFIHR